jgi:ATP-dependent DNA helicase DinG
VTVEERFEPIAIEAIREAIEEAGGNEVFLVGRMGPWGKVEEVTVGARGTEDAVPVLRPHLAQGNVVIHNHPSGELAPSGPDISIAYRLGNEGIGFFIVDSAVTRVYVVAEPVSGREIVPLDKERLAAELGPNGGLSRIYPLFEKRDSQMGMLRMVCDAFNGDEIAAIEGGTGVGKSLAYLVPAVSWSLMNDDRVVISTNTINLQQQLVEKDIPLVKKILGEDPKVVLMKGRGNYLCHNRLREALDELSLFKEENGELAAIREWARTTPTGSRTDLSFYPSDETWSRICSEADACLGLRCSLREGCFVLKARRDAASARIIVTNHHLLFSDLALRMAGSGFDDPAVLPPFRRIIFDEAHNIERAATSFFSRSLSRPAVLKLVGRIYRKKKDRVAGHYTVLVKLLGRKVPVKKIPGMIADIQQKAEELDAACLGLMVDEGNLLMDERSRPLFRGISAPLGNLIVSLTGLTEVFEEIFQLAPVEDPENLFWDCRVQVRRLTEIVNIADRFRLAETGANDVLWMEALRGQGTDRFARMTITPLDIAPLMREAVYAPLKTVVLTSATLTVAGGFDFWGERVGLKGLTAREPLQRIFPSPFNYEQNVLLGVPTDAPAPDQPGYQVFLSSFITEALRSSRGAGLVLFTSYALLREVCSDVQPALLPLGIRILRQGDDDRARLLERFREDTRSVLFATDSFWEGVDAPGETLQMVILSRLPFRVPSEPVLKARMAAIEEQGGNPFAQLSLPDAVMRLRQGFGRLMRRQDDRGVVLILDSRVVSKQYGAVFLDSLPRTRRAISRSSEVLREVDSFFQEAK